MINIEEQFYFDKTDLFQRIFIIEQVLDIGTVNNISALIVRLGDVEQTLIGLANDPVTSTYVDNRLLSKLNKIGDTLLGNIEMLITPTNPNHVINKGYIDTSVSALSIEVNNLVTTVNSLVTTGVASIAYVDAGDSVLQSAIDSIQLAVDILNTDTVNKTYTDTQDALKVNKTGDTLSGFLILHADPTLALHPATKQYVDNKDIGFQTTLTATQSDILNIQTTYATNVFVNTQDDALQLQLTTLSTTLATLNTDSVTKTYVDTNDILKVNKTGDTLSGFLVLNADPTLPLHPVTKQYTDNIVTILQTSLTDIQGTVTALNTDSVTKAYVDTQDALGVSKTGDVLTGFLTLHADPVLALNAVTKQYVDASINVIQTTVSGLGFDSVTKTYVDNQDLLKVNKSGDTLTGFLVLNADPTLPLHSATKQYVDFIDTSIQASLIAITATIATLNTDSVTKSYVDGQDLLKVSKSGDILTGFLTLHLDPISNMHPTTKQYVDSIASGLIVKASVRLATTVNLVSIYNNGLLGVGATLTATANGILSLDTTVVSVGDRVLVKDQITPLQNGPYNVQQVGTVSTPFILIRSLASDQSSEIAGGYFFINDGVILKNTSWVTTVSNPGTFSIGVDDINVNQFSGQGNNTAGTGLTLTGNAFNVNTVNSSRIVVNADNIDLATTGVAGGSYTKVTTDIYGRITTGSNPTTLVGYGITDAATIVYVDGVDASLQASINTLQTITSSLNNDPVSKGYVDANDNTKVNKGGDILTGFLVLHAEPISNAHPSSKLYVDTAVNAIQAVVNSINTTVTSLNTDSVTKAYVDTRDATKVNISGSSLSGFLSLHANPTLPLHAVTKQYADVILDLATSLNLDPVDKTYVDTNLATKVDVTGDILTGFLTLHLDPVANMHASTKGYVDTLSTAHQNSINSIQPILNALNLDPVTKSYVDNSDNLKVSKSGDTLTGFLVLNTDPTLPLHAVTKQYADSLRSTMQTTVTILETIVNSLNTDPIDRTYVDSQLGLKLSKTGDTLTGVLNVSALGSIVLANTPLLANEVINKGYVDTATTLLQTSLTDIQGTVAALNTDVVTKTYTDAQDALKVDLTGGTLTGFLILNTDPTLALHPATKGYVDTINTTLQSAINTLVTDSVTKTYVDTQDTLKLNKAGDNVTGFLTLHADPLNNLHAVTKQYVDNVVSGIAVKVAVRLGSTVNLVAMYNNGLLGVNATLTGTTNGTLTLDGNIVNVGDLVLIKDQTDTLQNGAYEVQQAGDVNTPFILSRIVTNDESSEIPGSFHRVNEGTINIGTGWISTVADPSTFTIGVDDIVVNQFSGEINITAGTGLTLVGNRVNVNTVSTNRIVINEDNIDLAITGVAAGSYSKVVVDTYGRVTGFNIQTSADIPNLDWSKIVSGKPNTLSGYGITNGQPLNSNLTKLSAITTAGILARDNNGELVSKSITVNGDGITITNGNAASAGDIIFDSTATSNATANSLVYRDNLGNFSANNVSSNLIGNSSTATKLLGNITLNLTGDATSNSVLFDGSNNVTLTTILSDTGVVAGNYGKVTVNSKGRIIAGLALLESDVPDLDWNKITTGKPTTLSGYGISDGYRLGGSDKLIIDGGSTRGALAVLGYVGNTNILNEGPDTWSVKIAVNNDLKVYTTDNLGIVTTALSVSSLTGISKFNSIMIESIVSRPGAFDVGMTLPSAIDRLNYNGCIYATNFMGNGDGLTGLNADNILSGTIDETLLPGFTGDVTAPIASSVLSLTNTGVTPATYTKVTVDIKGRVTSGLPLLKSDIPSLGWSKITSGKPTTLSGYGITDGVIKTGDTLTGHLSTHADPILAMQVANKQYVDITVATKGIGTGIIVATTEPVSLSGFLKCNGSHVDKLAYSDLFASVGDKYAIFEDLGNGRPWQQQYEINNFQTNNIIDWGFHTPLPVALAFTQSIVTNKKVYVFGGETSSNNYSQIVYSAPVNIDGTLGSWSTEAPLPAHIGEAQVIVIQNRVYIIGGRDSNIFSSNVYTATIHPDGSLGVWSLSGNLPEGVANALSIVIKNKVYLIGGRTSSGFTNKIYSADINTDGTLASWVLSTPLPFTVAFSQIAKIKNFLYIFGGMINNKIKDYVYRAVINPDNTLGTWVKMDGMPSKTQGHNVYVSFNKVFILGGLDKDNNNNKETFTAVINLDGSLAVWAKSNGLENDELGLAVKGTSLISTGNRIYLLGGDDGNNTTNTVMSAPITGSLSDYTNITVNNNQDVTKFRLPDLFKRELEDKIFYHIHI